MKFAKTTNKRMPHAGLYVLTDPDVIPGDRLVETVGLAISGGAVMVQYRNKNADAAVREREATALRDSCQQHRVPLIINDDVELAARIRADGVHLGKDDMKIREARALLGDGAIIGASCYNLFQNGLRAQQLGADYVAFGSFFKSSTKTGTVRAALELLHEARRRLEIPVIAIGGITPDNGRALVQAGANLIAACHGVFAQQDVALAAEKYARLFGQGGRSVVGKD
jgi:thiamine-phosphate pyrophosphorylase